MTALLVESTPDWTPATRRELLLTAGAVPRDHIGLEIGALNNPIVRPIYGDVRFVDYASTAFLREKHADYPERVADMVDVSYVWQGTGPLAESVGQTDLFDYVIASHVIEHVPNVLGWLRGICEVMAPGGVFNLALPDKRFTFDVGCPDSTVGQLVEADLLGYRHPSIRQMFDNCYYAKGIEPGAIWHTAYDVANTPSYVGDIAPDLALAQARQIVADGAYFDSHCWIFSPASFVDLMSGMVRLGMMPFQIDWFEETAEGDFEFFLGLRKPGPDVDAPTLRADQEASLARIKGDIDARNRARALLMG